MHRQFFDDIYGFCLYRHPETGAVYAFASSKSGKIEQLELYEDKNHPGTVNAKRVSQAELKSKTEGLAADDDTGLFFAAEEDLGIWSFSLDPFLGGEGIMAAKAGRLLKHKKSFFIDENPDA